MNKHLILAGDLGGTKANFAIFSNETGVLSPVYEDSFLSKDFDSFQDMVKRFVKKSGQHPASACFGVAGPVCDGVVNITKLSWLFSEAELQDFLSIPKVILLNDLAAAGYALPVLKEDDFVTIKSGEKKQYGTKIIVAPGTGLGETFLTWDGKKYVVHASEGGHALFSPSNSLQMALLDHLYYKYPQVTFDLICSGQGIPLIYDFLKFQDPSSEPQWLADKLSLVDDVTPVIVDSACDSKKNISISRKTIEMFADILAAECTNLALKTMACGGVYLAGGLPSRILEYLKSEKFSDTFIERKPFQEYLARIPVTVITNQKAPLIGAASYCLKKLENE